MVGSTVPWLMVTIGLHDCKFSRFVKKNMKKDSNKSFKPTRQPGGCLVAQ
jgi:hypothetical protein